MSVLASILFDSTLLGALAALAVGIGYYMTHGTSRATRDRSGLQRQRERQRREYWGFE